MYVDLQFLFLLDSRCMVKVKLASHTKLFVLGSS